jgi:hypothetical protein
MRSLLLVLTLLVLAGCSSPEPPHSDYFVVSFAAGEATLDPPAQAALERAVRDAKSGRPRAVAIKAYFAADGGGRELCDARLQAVQQALVGAGTPSSLIHLMPTALDGATLERLGNGVVVQIERGEPPPEKPPAAG